MEKDDLKRPLVISNVSVYAMDDSGEPVPRVESLSLTLDRGEWLNLVGVNGSGKTTIARLLAGIHMEGTVGSIDRGFAGNGPVPVVLQQPEAQLFGETPFEEIQFALEWNGVAAEDIGRRVRNMLELTGLTDKADVPWNLLSGGEKQLAAIAAAAACEAPLIVFDEATSMLDERHRGLAIRIVKELQRLGTAVVWVTHRLEDLMPEHRVAAIADGRLVFVGDARRFMYGEPDDQVSPCQRCGLRLPYLAELALELQRMGKLLGPLPITAEEWREAWGEAVELENGGTNGA